jgi:hypothetical protein
VLAAACSLAVLGSLLSLRPPSRPSMCPLTHVDEEDLWAWCVPGPIPVPRPLGRWATRNTTSEGLSPSFGSWGSEYTVQRRRTAEACDVCGWVCEVDVSRR